MEWGRGVWYYKSIAKIRILQKYYRGFTMVFSNWYEIATSLKIVILVCMYDTL